MAEINIKMDDNKIHTKVNDATGHEMAEMIADFIVTTSKQNEFPYKMFLDYISGLCKDMNNEL